MAAKNRLPAKPELDTLAELRKAVEARGRIPAEEALQCVGTNRGELVEIVEHLKCALGREGDSQFVVSTSGEARLQIISDFLGRHAPNTFEHKVLKQLVGIPESSSLLDRIIPKDHPHIRRRRGVYWWQGDGTSQPQLLSVANAARSLLYQQEGAENSFAKASERVRQKLRRIWERHELVIAVDGGRTNSLVAKELSREKLPSGTVGMVTYITNQKAVEQTILENRESSLHDPVLIGGRMREHSKTYIGRFAEACWHAYNITPDISLVATSTVGPTYKFATSDFEESRFKSLMLGGSSTTLRCITADSTKILSGKGGGWTFATLENIDVIVTDSDVSSGGRAFLSAAKDYGVLVVSGGTVPVSLGQDI